MSPQECKIAQCTQNQIEMRQASFHVLTGHLYVVFREMSYVLAHFLIGLLILLLSCEISLHLLDIDALSDI